VAGGVAGAAVGAAVTQPETVAFRRYVVAQRRPTVRVSDQVVVGYTVPPSVALYPVPARVGLRTRYDYATVNDRWVLVEPTSRQVVYIVE
jgi:hypothetical protein